MKRWPIVTAILAITAVVIGIALYNVYQPAREADQTENRSISREEALEQARSWSPSSETICPQVLTPAIHKETGAKYTFSTGCLAPGWERDESAMPSEPATLDDEPSTVNNMPADSPDTAVSSLTPTPSSANSLDAVDQSTQERASSTNDRILAEAKAYKPPSSQKCTNSNTPAVHQATGIRYNFPTTCLPSGWVATSSARGLGHY